MRGTLTVAYMIDEATIARLERKFEEALGGPVSLGVTVDPSLIGGFIVDINHRQYDYSIRNQLRQMAQRLIQLD